MTKNGWAADNLAFGSGGALLQKLNRDTQKCAFKCCSIGAAGVSPYAQLYSMAIPGVYPTVFDVVCVSYVWLD